MRRKAKTDKLAIRISMLERGLTHEKLAVEAGVTRECITQIVNGKLRTAHLQEFVAAKLGFPVRAMFPLYQPKPERQKVEA